MIQALIYWLILVVIVCFLYWLITQFAPPQIQKIALAVCIFVIILALVFLLLPLANVHVPR